jgi:hypothetical protein
MVLAIMHKLRENYFLNRFQITKMDIIYSILVNILLGVPQGSSLDPLLPMLYINDSFFIRWY